MKKQTSFTDLGSGVGKSVIAASLLLPFIRACGVELLPSLHAQAVATAQRFTLASVDDGNAAAASPIEFVCGDFFARDIRDADVCFVASTGFDDAMFARLAAHLRRSVRAGTIVMTLSLPLPGDDFRVLLERRFRFSWGNCAVYVSVLT